MIAEFGNEVPFKRVIDFARGKLVKIVEIYTKYSQTWLLFLSTASKAFDHKDVGVRDAAKALVRIQEMIMQCA